MATAVNLEATRPEVLNPSARHKWLVAVAVMLGATMEVLDTSIVNVSLPHMQGSFSASRDEITWVLTSYLVANGIMIPAHRMDLGALRPQTLLSVFGRGVRGRIRPLRRSNHAGPDGYLPLAAGRGRCRDDSVVAGDHDGDLSAA